MCLDVGDVNAVARLERPNARDEDVDDEDEVDETVHPEDGQLRVRFDQEARLQGADVKNEINSWEICSTQEWLPRNAPHLIWRDERRVRERNDADDIPPHDEAAGPGERAVSKVKAWLLDRVARHPGGGVIDRA